MKSWIKRIIVILVISYPAYFLVTSLAISYCANDLGSPHPHGCIYLFFHSGDETRFLMAMKNRSVKPIIAQIDQPDLPLKSKIHFAWILSKIDHHAYFSTFIDGLNSESDHSIAAHRMSDFPDICLSYSNEILNAGTKKQNNSYTMLLLSMIDHWTPSNDQDETFKYRMERRAMTTPLSQENINYLAKGFERILETHRADENQSPPQPLI